MEPFFRGLSFAIALDTVDSPAPPEAFQKKLGRLKKLVVGISEYPDSIGPRKISPKNQI